MNCVNTRLHGATIKKIYIVDVEFIGSVKESNRPLSAYNAATTLHTLSILFHHFSSSFCPLRLGGMNQKQTLVHSNSSSTSRNPGCVCIFSLKYLQLYQDTVLCGNVCLCSHSCSYKLMSCHVTFISNCITRSIA